MRVFTSILAVMLAAGISGCSRQAARDDAGKFEVVKTYDERPVTVTLKVERAKISVADRLKVVLEAAAPESEDVQLPERVDKLGEFTVADSQTAQPRMVEKGLVLYERWYVLEPFLAGQYKLPALTVGFSTKSTPGSEWRQIATEEVAVEVVSVLPPDEKQPALKEIADPVDMPAAWWPWIVGGIAVAGLIAALVWWRRNRRKREAIVPPLKPHEIAYRELDLLLKSGLLERGEAKMFYLRLSNVLRHYIEDRFGLRAPEQTTEEFLVELRQRQVFGERHKELLQSFLEHSDLVKFAELQPTRDEAETTVLLCRRFIEETKQEEVSTLEAVAAK